MQGHRCPLKQRWHFTVASQLRFEEIAPMGLIHANLQLLNPSQPEMKPLDVSVLADSGAVQLCIP